MGGERALRRGEEREPARERQAPVAAEPQPGGRQECSAEQGIEDAAALIRAGARERSEALRKAGDEERGVCVDPSGRSRFAWRSALTAARKALIGTARDAITARATMDLGALDNFEATMRFAAQKPTASLVIGALFNEILGRLPPPLSTAVKVVRLVSGIYDKAQSATRGATLTRWIQAHRDALRSGLESRFDGAGDLGPLDEQINALVWAEGSAAEAVRQEWELGLLAAKFELVPPGMNLEKHLYDQWCRENGATWIASVYRTDREYPGHEELGTLGPAERGGPQLYAKGVPPQIFARLVAMDLAPSALQLPTVVRHHERDAARRWRWTHDTVVDGDPPRKETDR